MDKKSKLASLLKECGKFDTPAAAETAKSLTAVLLYENVAYEKADNVIRIEIDGDTYAVSSVYVQYYLGEEAYRQIMERNPDLAEPVHYPEEPYMSCASEEDIRNELASFFQAVISQADHKDMELLEENAALKQRINELMFLNKKLSIALQAEKEMRSAERDRYQMLLNNGTGVRTAVADSAGYDMAAGKRQEQDHSEMVYELHAEELDINSDYAEAPAAEQVQEAAEEPVKEPVPQEETPVQPPKTFGFFPYAEDIYEMDKNELMFTYYKMDLVSPDKEILDSAELFVIPLTSKVEHPALLLWIAHDGEARSVCTQEGSKANSVVCGSFTVNVKGTMRGSRFSAFVELENDSVNRLNIARKDNGDRGHLYLDDDGMKVHICPVTFENGADGSANFVYAFEENGQILQSGDNMEGDIIFENHGVQKKLLVKWTGDTLIGCVTTAVF